MQHLALRTQDRIIGDFANEIVREHIVRLRHGARLDEEIQDFQRPEPALQLRARHSSDGGEQLRRNARSDYGRELQEGLVLLGQAVDAGGDDALHGWRNFQRIPLRGLGKAVRVGPDDAAVDELPRHLFDEERNLAGMAKDAALERGEPFFLAEQAVEQRVGRIRIKRAQPDPPHVELRQPARRIFGAPGQEHQEGPAGRQRHQGFDRGFALAVDPVQILQQQQCRPRRDQPSHHVAHGFDDHATAQQWLQQTPAWIGDRLVEHRRQRSGPEIGLGGSPFGRRGHVLRRQITRPQNGLQQFLQQRIGHGLLQRIALRLEHLPIPLPQALNELVRHAGLADPGRSHQGHHRSRGARFLRSERERGGFLRTSDKG